ncbi:GntR family transcriptional regulator [Roseovarius autotrophicus]|uniref:GntR family transcriptional regulator n=1 Tax=Roseovarius autotrophicus TaxID=2824121 RepID=UPI001B392243|nr:GntR family transcriptional regulator [Roseovarius autotrophicus]
MATTAPRSTAPGTPPAESPDLTLGQRAYLALRGMAISYQLAPGVRLNEVELARDLDVSRTPLREAINRLVSEGLLVANGRGVFARRLDPAEVRDLYEARLGLETFIVSVACERAQPGAINRLDAYLDHSVSVQGSSGIEELVRLDEGFHAQLAALTGNAELQRMLESIHARIHFFRWVDMRGRRDHTQAEHRRILAAIRAGDAPHACTITRAHINRRMDQIVEVIREGVARLHLGESPRPVDLAAHQGSKTR